MKMYKIGVALLLLVASEAYSNEQGQPSEVDEQKEAERPEPSESRMHGFNLGLRHNLTGKINQMTISDDFGIGHEETTGYTTLGLKYSHRKSNMIFSHGLEYGLVKDVGSGSSAVWDGRTSKVSGQDYSEIHIRMIDVTYGFPVMDKLTVGPAGGVGIGYAKNEATLTSDEFSGENVITSHKGFFDIRAGGEANYDATENLVLGFGTHLGMPIGITQAAEQEGDWSVSGIDDSVFEEALDSQYGLSLAVELSAKALF